MKLSEAVAKLTCGKAKLVTTLGGLVLAGAALTAAAPAANAQVAFGVAIGGPRYYAPVVVPPPPPPAYRPYGYAGYGYAPGYWQHRQFGYGYGQGPAYYAPRGPHFYGHGYWR